MNNQCPGCGSARTATTFELTDFNCGSRTLVNPRLFVESRTCIEKQRDFLRNEVEFLRHRLAHATTTAAVDNIIARHADPEGKTPSAIHAAMMSMELALGNSQKVVHHFDFTKPEWEADD